MFDPCSTSSWGFGNSETHSEANATVNKLIQELESKLSVGNNSRDSITADTSCLSHSNSIFIIFAHCHSSIAKYPSADTCLSAYPPACADIF